MSFTRRKKRGKSLGERFVPKKYQSTAIKFGLERPEAGFFLAPGLGKTIITLMIFRILKRLGIVDELVVLAKRRIVYDVWPKEIKKWRKTRKFTYSIVHGSNKSKRLWTSSDIKLINYDGLNWLKKQKKWFRRGKRLMLVCDESSKLRHTSTVRFRSLKKILPRFHRRYILTGSPAPSGLMGLFGQIYTLDLGETFGPYITHFRNEYFYPSGYMGYEWKLLPGARKKIFRKLRPLILRFGNDQLDLPPLSFIDRKITLSDKAMAVYKKMEKELLLEYEEGDVVADNAAVATGKLRQIANGGAYYSPKTGAILDESPKKMRKWRTMHEEKCAELVELLEELNGEPALVAYEFEHDKLRLQKYFRKHAPQFKDAPFIGGGMKDKDVAKHLKKWDKGKLPVMFGHPDSIAHGLNLQGKGGIVIFFALTWNLENYEQFIQRVWRQGQKRRVLVYRIIARDTVDEVMVYSLKAKDRTQQTLLTAMEGKYELRQTKRTRRARRQLEEAKETRRKGRAHIQRQHSRRSKRVLKARKKEGAHG